MARTVRVAAVQMIMGTYEQNLQKHIDFMGRAADERARIVVFPELAFRDEAEPLDGPTVTRLRRAAKEAGVWAVPCLWEQGADGRYVTSPLIGPDGEVHGVYRKAHGWPE